MTSPVARTMGQSRNLVFANALLFVVVSVALLAVRVVQMPLDQPQSRSVPAIEGEGDVSYAPAYRFPSNRLQVLYNTHDGQAFASLAMDPSLARPEVWSGGNADFAYRAGRPVIGWLAWAMSLGRPDLVQWILAVISVASAGLLGGAVTLLAHRCRRDVTWAP